MVKSVLAVFNACPTFDDRAQHDRTVRGERKKARKKSRIVQYQIHLIYKFLFLRVKKGLHALPCSVSKLALSSVRNAKHCVFVRNTVDEKSTSAER